MRCMTAWVKLGTIWTSCFSARNSSWAGSMVVCNNVTGVTLTSPSPIPANVVSAPLYRFTVESETQLRQVSHLYIAASAGVLLPS